MVPQEHMLRSLFHELVGDCYSQGAGVDDAEISTYVADLLTDFTENERIYSLRDEIGRPLRDLDAMLLAADPVNGTAASFDAERSARKQIGDYALFFAGMYPEAIGVSSRPSASSGWWRPGATPTPSWPLSISSSTRVKRPSSSASRRSLRPASSASTWCARNWTAAAPSLPARAKSSSI